MKAAIQTTALYHGPVASQSFVLTLRMYGFACHLAPPCFCTSNTQLGGHQHLENLGHYLSAHGSWQVPPSPVSHLKPSPSPCQWGGRVGGRGTQLRVSHAGTGLLSSIIHPRPFNTLDSGPTGIWPHITHQCRNVLPNHHVLKQAPRMGFWASEHHQFPFPSFRAGAWFLWCLCRHKA